MAAELPPIDLRPNIGPADFVVWLRNHFQEVRFHKVETPKRTFSVMWGDYHGGLGAPVTLQWRGELRVANRVLPPVIEVGRPTEIHLDAVYWESVTETQARSREVPGAIVFKIVPVGTGRIKVTGICTYSEVFPVFLDLLKEITDMWPEVGDAVAEYCKLTGEEDTPESQGTDKTTRRRRVLDQYDGPRLRDKCNEIREREGRRPTMQDMANELSVDVSTFKRHVRRLKESNFRWPPL